MKNLANTVHKTKNPTGTEEHPAKTCRDLHLDYPNYKNGKYWIDPNGGSKLDAVYVHCDFKTKFTCIKPVHSMINPRKNISTNSEYLYVTDSDEMEEEIEYTANSIQMNFLKLYSKVGYQSITYHCRNSQAWNDKHSIKLVGPNEVEYSMVMKSKNLRPTVTLNECNTMDGEWHKSVLEVRNKHRLPVVDVAVFDVKKKHQAFQLEFGPVCFA